MDALVISSMKNRFRLVVMFAAAFFFSVCIFLHISSLQSVHATDLDCEFEFEEQDNKGQIIRKSSCQQYFDPNTGKTIPGVEYLKCFDHILCDPEPNPDPDTKPLITKRCCIDVLQGSAGFGKYGAQCNNLEEINRDALPFDSGASSFIDMKPSNCEVDETALSPADEDVYMVPATFRGELQRVDTWVKQLGREPFMGKSVGGLPLYEEILSARPWEPIAQVFGPPRTITYVYEEDAGTRRYFVNGRRGSADLYLWENINYNLRHGPRDPRPRHGGNLIVGNLGCVINNAAKRVVFAGMSKVLGSITNNDNMPDISLLCSEGVPLFDDPSQVTIDGQGNISGFNAGLCHCVDENASPGNAALILCTRFIAGIGDGSVPWRSVMPVPDANGIGSQRYHLLLFGHIEETHSIDEFQGGVAREIREFFSSDDEIPSWITQLIKSSNDLLKTRFFGQAPWPTDLSEVDQNAFKSNAFVRQYISCLTCAKYGGFPTALGCMPAERVDRFLSEGVLGLGIGIAGAVSVLCIIYGAIQFQLSAGEAAKVQKAQKLITQCILGLLLILFSVFLLRFVGVNLLRIYGLG